MGAVSNLRAGENLGEFLDFLFGVEPGIVYAPTKDLDFQNKSDDKGAWTKHYFRWPQQRAEIIEHVESRRKYQDVYLAPALFSNTLDGSNKENVKGSHTLWVDFDGHVPSEQDLRDLDIPMPSWRNCSSVPGREHWFWKLPNFLSNTDKLQEFCKALTYALSGDLSGHSPAKVLRPVGGINHKRNAEEVTILSNSGQIHSFAGFEGLKVPEDKVTEADFNVDIVPKGPIVFGKYAFSEGDTELILKSKVTRRSEALTRIAFAAAEQGATDHEIYGLITWKDKQWGKFAHRPDAKQRYILLINYIRNKLGQSPVSLETNGNILKVKGYMDLVNTTTDVEFIIDGFLTKTGQAVLGGKSGTGKTLFTMDICRSLALGRECCGFKPSRPLKILFLSLEMPGDELSSFAGTPAKLLTKEEQDLLNQNFIIYSEPELIQFYNTSNPNTQKKIIQLRETIFLVQPDIVVIDSASVAFGDSLNMQEQVNESMRILYKARNEWNFASWIISHIRKDPPKTGGHNPNRMLDRDDIFGVQSLVQQSTSVFGLQQLLDEESNPTGELLLSNLKNRFGPQNSRLIVKMSESLTFYRPTMGELVPAGAPVATEGKDDGNNPFDNFIGL